MRTRWEVILHSLFEQRYVYLFIALLLPYCLHPLIENEVIGIILMDGSFSLVLLVALFAVSTQKHVRYVALAFMVAAQFMLWSNSFFQGVSHRLVSLGVFSAYLTYTTILLLARILFRRDVTSNTIFASLCIYLMIGYVWAFFFSMLEMAVPGSFAIDSEVFRFQVDSNHMYTELYYFMYYSFTSITSFGLGDILPASPWARVLTVLEAIIGQIYLVVLVSRLVGMHISQRNANS